MSKKIAILTLYFNNANYGGMLQAYALQKVISEMGHNVSQISYDLDSGSKHISDIKKKIRTLIKFYRYLKEPKWMLKRCKYEKNFRKFAKTIQHTKKVNVSNISKLTKEFDIFICGSDQIWNPIGWQPTLFLDFVGKENRKIAYAASVARDNLTKDEIDYLSKYISDFYAVSVREKITSEHLKESGCNKDIEVMPDPTILLSKEQWLKLVGNRKIEKPYIFAYFLGEDLEQRNKAIEFAVEKGYEIIFIPYMNKKTFDWDENNKKYMYQFAQVGDFLNLIYNAEVVVTDSFHGSVFSIIFEKNFYVMKRFKDGDITSMNSRIVSLLDDFGLEDRYISDIKKQYKDALVENEKTNIRNVLSEKQIIGRYFLNKNIG